MQTFKNEEEFKNAFKLWIELSGWTVKTEVKRQDTLTWEHPICADMLIFHPHYANLGWIGIEAKINLHTKTIAQAMAQIMAKYQHRKFEGIEQKIVFWCVAVDKIEWKNDFYNTTVPLRFLNQFGIGLFSWHWMNKYSGECAIYNDNYRRIQISEDSKLCVFLEEEKMQITDIDKLLLFLEKRTKWRKGELDYGET